MGLCSSKSSEPYDPNIVSKSHFENLRVVGQGGFGKVRAVEKKGSDKKLFALKELSKYEILAKKSLSMVFNERNILTKIKNHYIINMYYCFQDDANLYVVMDLMLGGDLRFHLKKDGRFTEDKSKFYIACTIKALEYLHSQNILHRDIKPDNIVMDSEGYVHLTDMGVAAMLDASGKVVDTSGTLGYMPLEVLERRPHGFAADFFALGVMAYEFMKGKRPYSGHTKEDFKKAMLREVDVTSSSWSADGTDFVKQLLVPNPEQRLGAKGAQQLMDHPWFKNFDWAALDNRTMKAPIIPDTTVANFDGSYDLQDQFEETPPKLPREQQAQFAAYDFNTGAESQQLTADSTPAAGAATNTTYPVQARTTPRTMASPAAASRISVNPGPSRPDDV
eukprot:GILK01003562.1.p1 GENE.GILK01003562.1~~GILK01003562.1.p1  ORF type:complete len:391 (+),score=80.30 GILK01003562.1:196-1368(+)